MDSIKSQLRKYEVRDYAVILFGTLLYGFGFNGFILSNEIVTGGLSGLCALIFFASGELIPVSVSYFVINIFLLVVALKILGWKFLVKTIFGVFSLSLSLSLFENVLDGPIIQGEPFMSIIIGGALCGTGLGMIFASNGSTGGTDIIGMIITKYRNISIGRAMLMLDFFIIGSSYFLFHDVTKIVFAFVEMVVSNYMLDQIVNGNRESVQFFIFSEKYEEISERIIRDMDRSCTILDGHGGYTKKPMKVLLVIVRKSESVTIFRFIKSANTTVSAAKTTAARITILSGSSSACFSKTTVSTDITAWITVISFPMTNKTFSFVLSLSSSLRFVIPNFSSKHSITGNAHVLFPVRARRQKQLRTVSILNLPDCSVNLPAGSGFLVFF